MNRPALDGAAATKRDDVNGELRPGHFHLPATIDDWDPKTGHGRTKRSRNDLVPATSARLFDRAAGAFSFSRKLLLVTLTLVLTFTAVFGTSTGSASADEPANFALFEANASGEGIGWKNAYLLSLLDYYVYDSVIPGATGNAFGTKFAEHFAPLGLSNFRYINIGYTDTQAMVVETDDAVIIAFRGTQQPMDWVVDALLGASTPEGIHLGFSTAALSAMSDVNAAIAAAPGKKIWLTGHSLGGAVAQATAYYLAAARIVNPAVPPVQGIVTFGSPRVFRTIGLAGPIYWANYGDFKSERWVNNNDPIPHTPWPIEFYHQSKWTRIVVDSNGACSLQVREIVSAWPDFADHDVPRYASRIYYMMPEQLRTGLPLPPRPAEPVANCDQPPGSSSPQLTDSNALDNVVNEGAPNGTPVGITAAPPTSAVGSLTYSLMSNAGGRFAIDPSTGVVTVANGSLLDFETATAHTIAVLASKEGLALVGIFRVYVADVPGAPVDTDTAVNQVTEGATVGTAVGITASSPNESGATVTYSLADNAGDRFAINASTGVVTVANGALLDGPATHYVRVVASHSGELSYAQTFAIAVLNVDPTATISSLNGGLSNVGFVGVPVSFGGSFADAAALDTHTARLDWGDGSALHNFGGGNVNSPLTATHTYQAAGSYAVSLTVQDDDGGTGTVTRTINVHDGLGGVTAVAATLEGLLQSETNPQVLKFLAQTLVELEGNDGGASTNGAVDALAAGDLVAALGKIEDAVTLLNQADTAGADTSDLRLMLALTARITAEKAQAGAIAAVGPSPSKGEQKQLGSIAASVVAGRAALQSGDYVTAIHDFSAAVQGAVALIG